MKNIALITAIVGLILLGGYIEVNQTEQINNLKYTQCTVWTVPQHQCMELGE